MDVNKYIDQLGGKDALMKLVEDFLTDAIAENCPPGEDRGVYRLVFQSGDVYECGLSTNGTTYARKCKSLFSYMSRNMGTIKRASIKVLGVEAVVNKLPELLSAQNGGARLFFQAIHVDGGLKLLVFKRANAMQETNLEAIFFPDGSPSDEEIKQTILDL